MLQKRLFKISSWRVCKDRIRHMKNQNKFVEWYWRVILTGFFAFIIMVLSLVAIFYVHEAGHFLAGSAVQIVYHHNLSLPVITNWVKILGIIPVPQQTSAVQKNVVFALGGSILILIAAVATTIDIHKRCQSKWKKWISLTIPVIIFIHELFGNFIFGTDNWRNKPLLEQSAHPILSNISTALPWALFVVTFALLWQYPFVENTLQRALKWLRIIFPKS